MHRFPNVSPIDRDLQQLQFELQYLLFEVEIVPLIALFEAVVAGEDVHWAKKTAEGIRECVDRIHAANAPDLLALRSLRLGHLVEGMWGSSPSAADAIIDVSLLVVRRLLKGDAALSSRKEWKEYRLALRRLASLTLQEIAVLDKERRPAPLMILQGDLKELFGWFRGYIHLLFPIDWGSLPAEEVLGIREMMIKGIRECVDRIHAANAPDLLALRSLRLGHLVEGMWGSSPSAADAIIDVSLLVVRRLLKGDAALSSRKEWKEYRLALRRLASLTLQEIAVLDKERRPAPLMILQGDLKELFGWFRGSIHLLFPIDWGSLPAEEVLGIREMMIKGIRECVDRIHAANAPRLVGTAIPPPWTPC